MVAPANLNTADRLIRQALKDAGRLQVGDTPKSEVYADCLSRMYDIINFFQTRGIKLWLNQILNVALTASTASYTLGPAGSAIALKPTRVLEAWYLRPNASRYPLNPLSWNEYYRLGNLSAQGSVNAYFVDKQTANLVVKIWQVPDATAALGTIDFLIQRQAVSPTELDENVALPIEWYLALRWALADEMASGQAQIIMERCASKAAFYRGQLEDWDVEDTSTKFQPDPQSTGLRRSNFR